MLYHLCVSAAHISPVRQSTGVERASHRARICAAVALLCALGLALAYAWTRCPWWDEGLFSDVAVSFRNTGHLHSSLLAPNSYVNLPAPERATYWQFPAYLLTLGAWLRIWPVSIYSVRLFSVAWACVFTACWFLFVRAFSRNETLALLAAVLVAFDYSVLAAASDGRMDMMCAALGMAALAAYACLRASHPAGAAILTGFFGAAALFSHPMGAVVNGCLLAVVLCDLRRLSVRFFAIAALPYLAFGLACLVYISYDPQLFFAQMKAISGYRVGGLSFTLKSIARDFGGRYLHFYFAPNGGSHRLKILVPLFGLAGLLTLLLDPKLRAHTLTIRLALICFLSFFGVAAVDDMKFPYYLVYVMPALAVCGSMWLHESFRRASPLRFLAGALAFGFLGANIANCLYYVRRNDFAHEFQPALATIEQLRRPADIVMAPSEFGFALGFHKPLVDDCYLGYASGIRARIYVMYSSCNPPPGSPAPWIWSREQLAAHYQTVYRNPAYAIYLRRPDGRTPVSAR